MNQETLSHPRTRNEAVSTSRRVVEIDELVRDPERLQARIEIAPKVVEQYARSMKAGSNFPPVTVYDVNGALLLVDGYHRVAAAELVALETNQHWAKIEAEIRTGTMTEAIRHAALANVTHGKPLKRDEYHHAFRMLGESGALEGLNSRSIADLMNNVVSHVTIWKWAKEDFPGLLDTKTAKDDEPAKRKERHRDRLSSQEAEQQAAVSACAQALRLVSTGKVTDPECLHAIASDARDLLEEAKRRGGDPDWSPY